MCSTNQVEQMSQILVDQMAISPKPDVIDKGIYKIGAHDFKFFTKINKTGATGRKALLRGVSAQQQLYSSSGYVCLKHQVC